MQSKGILNERLDDRASLRGLKGVRHQCSEKSPREPTHISENISFSRDLWRESAGLHSCGKVVRKRAERLQACKPLYYRYAVYQSMAAFRKCHLLHVSRKPSAGICIDKLRRCTFCISSSVQHPTTSRLAESLRPRHYQMFRIVLSPYQLRNKFLER